MSVKRHSCRNANLWLDALRGASGAIQRNDNSNGHKTSVTPILPFKSGDKFLDITINVFANEMNLVGREKVIIFGGSCVEGQYKKHISDIDVLVILIGQESKIPYIDGGGLKILTEAVKRSVQRLEQEGIYVVAVPPYTPTGHIMIDAAKGKIANEKGLNFNEIYTMQLQPRLYTHPDEAIMAESISDMLENFFRKGRLLSDGTLADCIEYVSSHASSNEKDPLAESLLNQRRKLISGFVTYATNIHLSEETLFKAALEISKEVSIALAKEQLKMHDNAPHGWSFSTFYKERKSFPPNVAKHAELIEEQRRLINDNERPTITTEELYAKTVDIFNYFVSEWYGSLKHQLIVEKRE